MFRRTRPLGAMGLALLWALTSTAAQSKTPEEQALKVGKRGEITLTQPTKVADHVLQRTAYVVQHRDSGADHFVRFLKIVTPDSHNYEVDVFPYAGPVAGEINCRLEPLSAPAKETTAYIVTENGVPRITKVAIKGESAVHVL